MRAGSCECGIKVSAVQVSESAGAVVCIYLSYNQAHSQCMNVRVTLIIIVNYYQLFLYPIEFYSIVSLRLDSLIIMLLYKFAWKLLSLSVCVCECECAGSYPRSVCCAPICNCSPGRLSFYVPPLGSFT